MKKFLIIIFIIISILFAICLIVTILAGNLTWKNVTDAGITVKESFVKVSHNISETSVKIKDTMFKKSRSP